MSSLTGQLLVAMPQMQDPRFARSVVYMCAYSEEAGAMGLVINKTIDALTLDELYAHLKIEPVRANRPQPVHFGGPVDPGRGFVLHSADYREEATLDITDDFAMTATIDILRAIAKGIGPAQAVLALGYAGWASGQLESEILANGWLTCPADPGLIFDADFAHKYDRALAILGVDEGMLSSDAGHA